MRVFLTVQNAIAKVTSKNTQGLCSHLFWLTSTVHEQLIGVISNSQIVYN